jgi:hypothetical protein
MMNIDAAAFLETDHILLPIVPQVVSRIKHVVPRSMERIIKSLVIKFHHINNVVRRNLEMLV